MTRRTLRALLLAAAALMLLPGLARACNYPTLVVRPDVVGPGDTMYYTISNVTPGAAYVFRVGSVEISGTAGSTSVTGSFTMPNLGDRSTGFEVGGEVEHSDIDPALSPTGDDRLSLQDTDGFYRVSALGSDRAGDSQPSPSTPPAAAPDDRAPGSTGPTGEPPRHYPVPGETRPLHPTGPTPAPSPTGAPGETRAPAAAIVPAIRETRAASVSRDDLQPRAAGRAQERPSRPRPARETVPARALRAPMSAAASVQRAGASERAGPALPLVLFAGLSSVAICAAWLVLLLRRGGEAAAPSVTAPVPPSPPDANLEAELQEIVAEERLKRFDDEHGRDAAERGEPVRAGPG